MMKQKIFHGLICMTYLFLFMYFFTEKLVVGGRWGTGLFLGGVDNWLSGGSMYVQSASGYTSGPVYNPGGLFVSLIARLIFGNNASIAVIAFGGLAVLLLFWGYARLLSEYKAKSFWVFICCLTFFFLEFPWARFYLFELHPDIPVLMCFVWGIIFIGKYMKGENKLFYVIATLMFFCAGLFKQNALFLYVGLGLYILLTKKISNNKKIALIFSEVIAGLGVILVVLIIDGAWYNCVTMMASHSMININEYMSYVIPSIRNNFIFILLVLGYLFLRYKKIVKVTSIEEQMYTIPAVLWFGFCMYGAGKVGSNCGNVEVAFIALMPFVVPVIEVLIRRLKFYPLIKNNIIILTKFSKTCCCLLCICLIFVCVKATNLNVAKIHQRLDNQHKLSIWLNEKFPGRNITYNAEVYEILNDCNLRKKTDLFVVSQYSMGNLINDNSLDSISKKEKWDIILTTSDYGQQTWPITFARFRKLDKKDYPDVPIYGQSLEIYIKK